MTTYRGRFTDCLYFAAKSRQAPFCRRGNWTVRNGGGRTFLTETALAVPLVIGLSNAALGQERPFLYVPYFYNSGVQVFDLSTQAPVSGLVLTGAGVRSVAVKGDQSVVLVTNNGSGTVSVFDTATNTVTATINVGTGPDGVTYNSDFTRAYVALNDGHVAVIDTQTNTVLSTIAVGMGSRAITLSPDGAVLFVANSASNNVSVINTATDTVVATFAVGSGPRGIAFSSDGQFAYVTNAFNNNVSVIDTSDYSLVTTIAVGTTPENIAISPDGTVAYVTNHGSNTVSVIDTASNTLANTISLGGSSPVGVVFDPDGSKAYVTSWYSPHQLAVIDTSTHTVSQTVPSLQGPSGPGICSNGNALLATGRTFVANNSGALGCTGPAGAVFTGGTLQVAGTNIASAVPVTLQAAGGTIDTQGNVITLTGGISGPGALTKTGIGTLVLSGASTYTGGTTIADGILQATVTGALGTGPVTVNDILELTDSFDAQTLAITSVNGRTIFLDASTAGNATIINDFNGVLVFGDAFSADTASAGNATIVNGTFSATIFGAFATAGNATITNQEDPFGSFGGTTIFSEFSTAGNATIITENGGITEFYDNSTGGNARFITDAGGIVDFDATIGPNSDDKVSAGSIEGAGDYFLGANELTVGSNNRSTEVAGIVADGSSCGCSGVGASLVKVGTGTLTFSGIGSYTGGTSVLDGALIVNGVLAAPVTVEGGTLGGIGTVGGIDALAGGIVAPGNSIGTLNVAGDVRLGAGSIYEVELAGNGTSDLIAATGAATLEGGTVSVFTLDPQTSYQTGQTYTILTAGDGVTGTFDPAVLSNSAFLDAELIHTANAVDLMIAVRGSDPEPETPALFVTVAATPNQLATAGALDSLEQSGAPLALYNSLLLLDAASARAAFDQLSGEVHASLKSALLNDSRFVANAATDRIRAAFESVAAPSLPVMAYGEGGTELASAGTERFAVWGEALGGWGSFDGDGNAASFDRSTGGLLMGGDALVGQNWRLGVIGGYTRTSFDANDRASSGDSDNYHLGLYGGSQWGALGLRAGAAYTWHSIETARTAAFPGFAERLTADYDAGTAQAFGEFGYRIDTAAASFEPFAGLAHVSLRSDAFTEQGGAAALASAKTTTEATFTTLGLRAATGFTLGSIDATARGTLGWRHAFGDITPLSSFAFSGSDAFAIAGTPIAKDALVLEAGLDLDLSPAATLGLSYNGQIASNAQDHGFKANVAVKF